MITFWLLTGDPLTVSVADTEVLVGSVTNEGEIAIDSCVACNANAGYVAFAARIITIVRTASIELETIGFFDNICLLLLKGAYCHHSIRLPPRATKDRLHESGNLETSFPSVGIYTG